MSEELVVLMTASDENEARIVQAVLRASGIAAVVEGTSLMDEWAVSQRALGKVGSEVKVAAEQLEEAQQALERARETGIELAREDEDSDAAE